MSRDSRPRPVVPAVLCSTNCTGIPQQGINRVRERIRRRSAVCQFCQLCQSRRLATICDVGSSDEIFERMTDGGVARTTPH